jgi:hypothetical protein
MDNLLATGRSSVSVLEIPAVLRILPCLSSCVFSTLIFEYLSVMSWVDPGPYIDLDCIRHLETFVLDCSKTFSPFP